MGQGSRLPDGGPGPATGRVVTGEVMTGVYTSLRTRDGALPPTWDAHVARLGRDAAAVGLVAPSPETLADQILRVVATDADVGVRIDLGRGHDGGTAVTIATRDPGPAGPSSAVTVLGVRPRPHHKTTDDPVVARARATAIRAGTDDALLADAGALLEADSAAVALVRGRELATPRGPVLPSITMDEVCRHAEALGLTVVRRVIAVGELHAADEALLASAVRGVRALVAVDGRAIGDARPGLVTARLASAWQRDHVSSP